MLINYIRKRKLAKEFAMKQQLVEELFSKVLYDECYDEVLKMHGIKNYTRIAYIKSSEKELGYVLMDGNPTLEEVNHLLPNLLSGLNAVYQSNNYVKVAELEEGLKTANISDLIKNNYGYENLYQMLFYVSGNNIKANYTGNIKNIYIKLTSRVGSPKVLNYEVIGCCISYIKVMQKLSLVISAKDWLTIDDVYNAFVEKMVYLLGDVKILYPLNKYIEVIDDLEKFKVVSGTQEFTKMDSFLWKVANLIEDEIENFKALNKKMEEAEELAKRSSILSELKQLEMIEKL